VTVAARPNLEAAVALAMLPLGVVVGVLSALAMIVLAFATLLAVVFWLTGWSVPDRPLPLIAFWSGSGALVGTQATVTAIEALGELAWRPLLRAVTWWLAWGGAFLLFLRYWG
jgi:hypothetical protein